MGAKSVAVVLVAVGAAVLPGGASGADRVYWSNLGGASLGFANLDGSGGGALPLPPTAKPDGLAFDIAGGHLLWADAATNSIRYLNLDGSGGGVLPTRGAIVDHPSGIVLSAGERRVYWANDVVAGSIAWASLDGSGGGIVPTAGATTRDPSGVALASAEAFGPQIVYWANSGANTISYAFVGGTGAGDLNTFGADVSAPAGVALDVNSNRIFWANRGSSTIAWASLGGAGGGTLATAGATVSAPTGVAVDAMAGRVYWANAGTSTLGYARLDGSGGANLPTVGAPTAGTVLPALFEAPAPGIDARPDIQDGFLDPQPRLFCWEGGWAEDLPSALLYRARSALAYQWARNGDPLPGKTLSVLRYGRAGSYTCTVTASNFAGATSQTSYPYHAHALCVVPRLLRKTVSAAVVFLRSRHCRAGLVTRAFSPHVRRGRIAVQSWRPGTRLKWHAKVSLVVSRGKRPRR